MTFRAIVGYFCLACGAVFLGINSLILFRGAYKFGHDEVDKIAFGIAAAVIPWVIAVMPALVVETWRPTVFGFRRPSASTIAVAITWVAFIGYNLTTGAGVIATSRLETVADREQGAQVSLALREHRERLRAQLAGIPPHRPPEAVEPLLEAQRNQRAWKATDGCVDVTRAASRAYCDAYKALESELMAGRAAEKLGNEVAALDTQIATAQPVMASSDPQADLLHDVTGASRDKIQIWLPASTPIVLEIGAGLMWHFGFSVLGISLRSRDASESVAGANLPPAQLYSPEAINRRPEASVFELTRARQLCEWFFRECAKPSPAGSLLEREWYDLYAEICRRHNDTPIPLEGFRRIAARNKGMVIADIESGGGMEKHYLGYLPFVPAAQPETA